MSDCKKCCRQIGRGWGCNSFALLDYYRDIGGFAAADLWGEERIANELLLKLGIQVSPRTVSKYLPKRPTRPPRRDMRWSTFLRLHAPGIIACDFFVAVTATLRLLYVFVVIEHCSRRLIHCNVTAHPSAAWALQQLREAIGLQDRYEYLLHDRDSIFASYLDEPIGRLGVNVLKSPPHSPMANAICERVIGSMMYWTRLLLMLYFLKI